MPEQVGKSNMVKIFEGEKFTTTDGSVVNGPLNVRVHEFEDLGLLQIQADKGALYEVNGKTIQDFIDSIT
jgi:hypothetical protein